MPGIDVEKYLRGQRETAAGIEKEITGVEKGRAEEAKKIEEEYKGLRQQLASRPEVKFPDLSQYKISEKDIPKIQDTYQNMGAIGKIAVSLASVVAGAQLYHLDPTAPLTVYTSMVNAFKERDLENYMKSKDEFTQKLAVMKQNLAVDLNNTNLKLKAAQLGDQRYADQVNMLANRINLLKTTDSMINQLYKRLGAVQKNMDDILKEAIKQQQIKEREVSVAKIKEKSGKESEKQKQNAIKVLENYRKTLEADSERKDITPERVNANYNEIQRILDMEWRIQQGQLDPKVVLEAPKGTTKETPSDASDYFIGAGRFRVEEIS